MTYFKIS